MSGPWTAGYDRHVPATLAPYPDKTLVDYLRASAREAPGAPALLFKGGQLSCKELDTLSDRFAAALISFGVRPDDRVALVLPNCPQFLIAELGAWKAGATVLPLNPLYTEAELVEPLTSSGAKLAVTLTPFYQRIKDVQSRTAINRVIATNIKEYLPLALRVLFTFLKEKKGGHRIQLQPGDTWFRDCVAHTGHDGRHGLDLATPDGNAVMLLSGGTTGTPKAVMGKHRDLVASGLQVDAWLRPPDTDTMESPAEAGHYRNPAQDPAKRPAEAGHYRNPAQDPAKGPAEAGHYRNPAQDPAKGAAKAGHRRDERGQGDIVLLPLPLFHVYACAGVQTHALVSRTPLALVPNPRDLDDLLRTIERVRPTLVSAVPALFIALLNHPRVKAKKVDFTSIRACFSGSAPLLAATKARFEELSGGRIVEGYSLTEAMMACVVNPLGGTNKLGSVGLPLPDVEVAIVDPESGERVLGPGETGEIIVRGPQLMSGYWNNPEETARALRSHDVGGAWLHTGDLGYLDGDSYLFIVDRQKDLIKTSGYQVWPREIEEVLASHPAVMDVGVAGIADEMKGEVVKAWVVCKPGTTPTSEELRAYCRSTLAPFKVPAQIEFRESLPKTMTGKVLRRALK